MKPTFPIELDEIVKFLLQDAVGAHKAITRETLLDLCQPHQICTDSEMRLAIQALRENGEMICNMEDGRGYFMAATVEEYEAFKAKYTAKARSTFAAAGAMDLTARQKFDYHPEQEKMEGVYNVPITAD